MKNRLFEPSRVRRVRLPRPAAWLLAACALGVVGSPAVGATPEPAAPPTHQHHAPAPDTRPPSVEEIVGSLEIPDIWVRNQENEELRFSSDVVADKVAAINFIFTTCTTICPPMGANFRKLQEMLGEEAGQDVRLISVSVDPVTDTPERLRLWGERFEAGPGWTLVTGNKVEIDRLLRSLRVFTPDFAEHAPILLVGSKAAGWKKMYGLAAPGSVVGLIDEIRHSPAGGER